MLVVGFDCFDVSASDTLSQSQVLLYLVARVLFLATVAAAVAIDRPSAKIPSKS